MGGIPLKTKSSHIISPKLSQKHFHRVALLSIIVLCVFASAVSILITQQQSAQADSSAAPLEWTGSYFLRSPGAECVAWSPPDLSCQAASVGGNGYVTSDGSDVGSEFFLRPVLFISITAIDPTVKRYIQVGTCPSSDMENSPNCVLIDTTYKGGQVKYPFDILGIRQGDETSGICSISSQQYSPGAYGDGTEDECPENSIALFLSKQTLSTSYLIEPAFPFCDKAETCYQEDVGYNYYGSTIHSKMLDFFENRITDWEIATVPTISGMSTELPNVVIKRTLYGEDSCPSDVDKMCVRGPSVPDQSVFPLSTGEAAFMYWQFDWDNRLTFDLLTPSNCGIQVAIADVPYASTDDGLTTDGDLESPPDSEFSSVNLPSAMKCVFPDTGDSVRDAIPTLQIDGDLDLGETGLWIRQETDTNLWTGGNQHRIVVKKDVHQFIVAGDLNLNDGYCEQDPSDNICKYSGALTISDGAIVNMDIMKNKTLQLGNKIGDTSTETGRGLNVVDGSRFDLESDALAPARERSIDNRGNLVMGGFSTLAPSIAIQDTSKVVFHNGNVFYDICAFNANQSSPPTLEIGTTDNGYARVYGRQHIFSFLLVDRPIPIKTIPSITYYNGSFYVPTVSSSDNPEPAFSSLNIIPKDRMGEPVFPVYVPKSVAAENDLLDAGSVSIWCDHQIGDCTMGPDTNGNPGGVSSYVTDLSGYTQSQANSIFADPNYEPQFPHPDLGAVIWMQGGDPGAEQKYEEIENWARDDNSDLIYPDAKYKADVRNQYLVYTPGMVFNILRDMALHIEFDVSALCGSASMNRCGTPPPSRISANPDSDFIFPSYSPQNGHGFTFERWSSSSDLASLVDKSRGEGTACPPDSYAVGDTYSKVTTDLKFYACWKDVSESDEISSANVLNPVVNYDASTNTGTATLKIKRICDQGADDCLNSTVSINTNTVLPYSAPWSLRTPGDSCDQYVCNIGLVDEKGELKEHGAPTADAFATRPMMFINLEVIKQYKGEIAVGACSSSDDSGETCVSFGGYSFDVIGIEQNGVKSGICEMTDRTGFYTTEEGGEPECLENTIALLLSDKSAFKPSDTEFCVDLSDLTDQLSNKCVINSDYSTSSVYGDSTIYHYLSGWGGHITTFWKMVENLHLDGISTNKKLNEMIISRSLLGGADVAANGGNQIVGSYVVGAPIFPLSAAEFEALKSFNYSQSKLISLYPTTTLKSEMTYRIAYAPQNADGSSVLLACGDGTNFPGYAFGPESEGTNDIILTTEPLDEGVYDYLVCTKDRAGNIRGPFFGTFTIAAPPPPPPPGGPGASTPEELSAPSTLQEWILAKTGFENMFRLSLFILALLMLGYYFKLCSLSSIVRGVSFLPPPPPPPMHRD